MTTERVMPAPEMPDVFLGERDTEIRKGGGMTEDRPVISYAEYQALQQRPGGESMVRKNAMLFYGPGRRDGQPGGDRTVQIALPAEKYMKWWGQGYRPVDYVAPPPPAPPSRWYASMVEEAIANGEPIPEELRPVGYYGPTFKAGQAAQTPEQVVADEGTAAELAQARQELEELQKLADEIPDIFRCTAEGCARFFDSQDGLNRHVRDAHKEAAS